MPRGSGLALTLDLERAIHNFTPSRHPRPHHHHHNIITMMASRFFPATLRSAAVARAPTAVARSSQAIPRRFASTAKDPLLAEQKHATEHAAKSADLWRKISMYFCLPGA